MIICEYCGYGNEDNAPGCTQCGAPRNSAFGIVQEIATRTLSIAAIETFWEVLGTDISVWNSAIDFFIMAKKAQFTFIRAGYGDGYLDNNLEVNRTKAYNAGMEFGLYWYCKVGQSYEKHAQAFYEIWKKNPGKLPPVMDFETTILDIPGTTSWIYNVLRRFTALSGVMPMIYTSPGWWNSHVTRNTWARNYWLWVAHWTTALTPILPYDWQTVGWKFWQYSADGNELGDDYGATGDADMDLNRFNGTVSSFNATFGTNIKQIGDVTIPVEPTPIAVSPLYRIQVTTDALNVRALPDATSTDFGDIKLGDILPIVEENGDWLRISGWIHKGYVRKL